LELIELILLIISFSNEPHTIKGFLIKKLYKMNDTKSGIPGEKFFVVLGWWLVCVLGFVFVMGLFLGCVWCGFWVICG